MNCPNCGEEIETIEFTDEELQELVESAAPELREQAKEFRVQQEVAARTAKRLDAILDDIERREKRIREKEQALGIDKPDRYGITEFRP